MRHSFVLDNISRLVAVLRSGRTSMVQTLYLPHGDGRGPLAGGDAGQGPSYVISLRQPLSDDGM